MERSQKAVSLIYLACGFVSWLFLREFVSTAWLAAGIPMPADWVVLPPDMIAAAAGVAVFVVLFKSGRVNEFTNDVITELGKVVWPNRKETVLSTGVVSVLVALCSVIFLLFDLMWGRLVMFFYK